MLLLSSSKDREGLLGVGKMPWLDGKSRTDSRAGCWLATGLCFSSSSSQLCLGCWNILHLVYFPASKIQRWHHFHHLEECFRPALTQKGVQSCPAMLCCTSSKGCRGKKAGLEAFISIKLKQCIGSVLVPGHECHINTPLCLLPDNSSTHRVGSAFGAICNK